MNPPRRARGPPLGYDPRMMNRVDARSLPFGPDYDDPYAPVAPYDSTHPGPAFMEPHPQYPGYRDNRSPPNYRATVREPYLPTGTAPYKILCITNINPKIGDGTVKDALNSDFSRFGDVSVSICHDSGERLAYIYFRSFEEARSARHAKSRTILFDRPIEIEPIYEPRTSPMSSPPPPPPTMFPRRRSITPPDPYYEINGPVPPDAQRPSAIPSPVSHHRLTPPNYPHASRYPVGPGPSPPLPPGPMPYGRYHTPSSHLPSQGSPYSSPPHELFRSYHPNPDNFPHSGYSPYHPPYGHPPMVRERERITNDGQMSRSPRHEHYYPVEQRGYPAPPPHHSSQSLYSSSSQHHHLNMSPHITQQSSSSSYHSPPNAEPPRYMSREYRREKFESYNSNHDESRPSRVLIVNNIDATKSDSEIRDAFESFGIIEDVEVRKIGSDISSALIKFSSMDAAYKAKTATNGRYIGNMRCRIIYGKVNASRRLWIGGLSPTSTLACLEDEVSKFGEVVSLDYTSGRPYAYVEYESSNQAQFAAHHLRSTLIAAAERKIRIEFVDSDRSDKVAKHDSSLQISDMSSRSRTTNESWSTNEHEPSPQSIGRKRSITPNESSSKRTCKMSDLAQTSDSYRLDVNISTNSSSALKARLSSIAASDDRSLDDRDELNNNQDVERRDDVSEGNGSGKVESRAEDIDLMNPDRLIHCTSIRDIVHCCSVTWFGQLVLRNFNFQSKIFMCSGRKSTIEKYLTRSYGENGDQCPILRITQRWRLHPQPKLEEVKRRMQTGNLGMLIITSRPDQSPSLSSPSCKTPQSSTSQQNRTNGDNTDTEISANEKSTATDNISGSEGSTASQTRPLKNLISYLEQKDAAGVISLNAVDREQADGSKLLYAFPPGDFALNLLKRLAPKLSSESTKEEFLLGVIVGSTETKV